MPDMDIGTSYIQGAFNYHSLPMTLGNGIQSRMQGLSKLKIFPQFDPTYRFMFQLFNEYGVKNVQYVLPFRII